MSCLHYCCYCCCYCCDQCCPHRKQKPDKPVHFPHIEYKSPDQANQFVSAHGELEKVPLERHYVFAQPPSEGRFHHHHPTPTALLPVVPVTEQPRRQVRSYTPTTHSPTASPVRAWRHSTPEPSSTSVLSDSGTMASLQSAADSHPTLQFSLYYDIQRRVLAVHIQQAYNLPVVAKGTTTIPCSPFIVLFLLPNKEQVFESRISHKDLNPFFNQIFDFPGLLPEDIRKQTLVMKVFHSRRTKPELIGMISVSLEDTDLYGVSMKMSIDEKVEHFSSECKGQVLLSITHRRDTGSLHGIILRAKNLQKVNGSGTACPYIKVYQVQNGKRQHKWKSSVKKNTLMPIFNEPFRFEIPTSDLHSVGLEIIIMDHNRFSGDETMGVIRIGDSAPEETGRSHWSEVVRTPEQAVSRWHAAWPVTHVYDGGSDRESIVTN